MFEIIMCAIAFLNRFMTCDLCVTNTSTVTEIVSKSECAG